MRRSRRVVIGIVLVALAAAGAATAAVVTRTLFVRAGHCTFVRRTRVCAVGAPARTIRRVRTVVDVQTVTRTVTLAAPAVTTDGTKGSTGAGGATSTGRSPSTTTSGSTPTTSSPPSTTTSTTTPSTLTLDFSGSDDRTLAPFTTTVGETLSWTWQNTNGDFLTGMNIFDDSGNMDSITGGETTTGSGYLPPGTHTLDIITIGNWTIHIS